MAHPQAQAVGPRWQISVVIARHKATNRNARTGVQKRHHRIKNSTPDIFEIDVDALGASELQLRGKIGGFVIKAKIKAQTLDRIGAFLRPTCHAHNPAPQDLADLPHRGPHGASGSRHAQGFARFGLANLGQPCPSRHAGHPQDAQGPTWVFRLRPQVCDTDPIGQGVILPAGI